MKTIKVLFSALVMLLSLNTNAQIYPLEVEVDIQRYEIMDVNKRLNKAFDLIDESGKQKNIALVVGLSGGLLSSILMIKGKTSSVRNTGLAIGGITLATSLYFTIESNKRLREVSGLKL